LIVPRKERFVVVDKAIVVVTSDVRRIEVNEVSSTGRRDGRLEIAAEQCGVAASKEVGTSPKVVEIRDETGLRKTIGHVEFAT